MRTLGLVVARSFSADCIVLRKYRFGETHKGLVLATEGRGILHAIAHGALRPGSRLASGTEPLTLSRGYFYHEPVKDSYKVTDVSVLSSFETIKSDIVRLFTASLWIEVMLKSLGGGEMDASVFALLRDSLRGLDAAADADLDGVDLQFLWRFLRLAGFLPDLGACSSCGAGAEDEEVMYHLASSRSLVCSSCAPRLGSSGTPMSPGARRYLAYTLGVPLERAAAVRLAPPAARPLRRLTLELVQSVLEAPLKTLEAGAGIL